jgi:hypothetical protein
MSDCIRRQDVPPRRRTPHREIHRVLGFNKLKAVCLSKTVWGLWTHWNGRASIPCTSHRGSCTGHRQAWPMRWKGLLHVWSPETTKHAFVELTARAANMLIDQLAEGELLRGCWLELERSKGGRNGRLCARILGRLPDLSSLPNAEDPFETLCVVWGWDPNELDAPHPQNLP